MKGGKYHGYKHSAWGDDWVWVRRKPSELQWHPNAFYERNSYKSFFDLYGLHVRKCCKTEEGATNP